MPLPFPAKPDRVADAVIAYRAHYSQSGIFNSIPYPGIAEALVGFQEIGARLFLATSKRRNFAQLILEHLDFATFFEGIYGPEVDGPLSHKPELISYVIERHALTKSSCVMVGDRHLDIAGAHANQISALGVLWGYGSRDELEAARADSLITEPRMLPEAALALIGAGYPSQSSEKTGFVFSSPPKL